MIAGLNYMNKLATHTDKYLKSPDLKGLFQLG